MLVTRQQRLALRARAALRPLRNANTSSAADAAATESKSADESKAGSTDITQETEKPKIPSRKRIPEGLPPKEVLRRQMHPRWRRSYPLQPATLHGDPLPLSETEKTLISKPAVLARATTQLKRPDGVVSPVVADATLPIVEDPGKLTVLPSKERLYPSTVAPVYGRKLTRNEFVPTRERVAALLSDPDILEAQLTVLRGHFELDAREEAQRTVKGLLKDVPKAGALIDRIRQNPAAAIVSPRSMAEVRHLYTSLLQAVYHRAFSDRAEGAISGDPEEDPVALAVTPMSKLEVRALDVKRKALEKARQEGVDLPYAETKPLAHRPKEGDKLVKRGEAHLPVLERIFAQYSEFFTPTAMQFTMMITAYGKAGQPHKAQLVFEQMAAKGVVRDTACHNALITAFVRSGQLDKAIQMMKEMRSHLKLEPLKHPDEETGRMYKVVKTRHSHVQPDAHTYTILIDGAAKQGDAEKAIELYQEMLDYGIKPSHYTYAALMEACGNARDSTTALDLFKEMKKNEIYPNLVHYNIVLNALAKEGKVQKANALLNDLLADGLVPTEGTIVPIILAAREAKAKEDVLALYARLTAGQLGLVKPTLDVVCETLAALGEGLNADPLDPQARAYIDRGIQIYREAVAAGLFKHKWPRDKTKEEAVIPELLDLRKFSSPHLQPAVVFALYAHLRDIARAAGVEVTDWHAAEKILFSDSAGRANSPAVRSNQRRKEALKAASPVAEKVKKIVPRHGLRVVVGKAPLPEDYTGVVFTEGLEEKPSPSGAPTSLLEVMQGLCYRARPLLALRKAPNSDGLVIIPQPAIVNWVCFQLYPELWPRSKLAPSAAEAQRRRLEERIRQREAELAEAADNDEREWEMVGKIARRLPVDDEEEEGALFADEEEGGEEIVTRLAEPKQQKGVQTQPQRSDGITAAPTASSSSSSSASSSSSSRRAQKLIDEEEWAEEGEEEEEDGEDTDEDDEVVIFDENESEEEAKAEVEALLRREEERKKRLERQQRQRQRRFSSGAARLFDDRSIEVVFSRKATPEEIAEFAQFDEEASPSSSADSDAESVKVSAQV